MNKPDGKYLGHPGGLLKPPIVAMQVLIVRDRASSGGGIYNYYQAIAPHLKVRYRFVDVGRPHNCYGSQSRTWLVRLPTPLRLLIDWVNLAVQIIRWPGLVLLNPSLDPVEMRSLRRDAVNLFLAKLFRRSVIVFWRGWEGAACGTPEFPRGNAAWMSRVYRWANAHIVLASDFRNDLRRWGFVSPVYLETTVVADFIIDGLEVAKIQREDKVFHLLYLSRVEVAKGVFELLDAVALLDNRHPGRYDLTIAGDGPDLISLKHRASELRLRNVDFIGYVDGNRKVRCLAEASAFCFLSYTEGMPNAALEAMAAGLPLVSSDAGGLKDILQNGVTGFIVAQDCSSKVGARFSPNDVAERIELLAASDKLCRRIGAHNRQYAHERFAAAKVASRLQVIYREVTKLITR